MAVDDSYTKLLLHFNGSDNGTTFTDESGKSVSVVGNACTKTGAYKFGTASAYFDGTGDYLTSTAHADWAFGTGDFCIDFWIKTTQAINYPGVITQQSDNSWGIFLNNTGKIGFYNHPNTTLYWSNTSVNTNSWVHVAFTRASGTLRCFVNGVSDMTPVSVTSDHTSQNTVYIGRSTNNADFNGYLDEIRISKGAARWTTDFTPYAYAYGSAQSRKPIYINTGVPTEFGSFDSLAVANGGTGALTAADARTNLGLAIGADVAAYSHNHTGTYTPLISSTTDNAVVRFNGTGGELQSITALTVADNGQIVSTLATGTKPLDVTSTTVCTNLNADTVDGKHNTDFVAIGLHTIWIPAAAMYARTTNGAASGTAEMSTNKNMFKTLDFDTTTAEYAQFAIQMPKSWDEGTVTAAFVWSHAATTTNFGVAFGLQGVAISNDDAGDVAFGTAQLAVDTGGTTNDVYVSPTTSAITIAGTPAANDYVMFQVYRAVSDNGDTMGIDARLHGVQIYYTIDAGTDA